jgi:hypothetical protein
MYDLVVSTCISLLSVVSELPMSDPLRKGFDETEIMYQRGVANFLRKKNVTAMCDLLTVHDRYSKPHHFDVVTKLGHLCMRNNDYPDAIKYFTEAVEMHMKLVPDVFGDWEEELHSLSFSLCAAYCKNGQFRKGLMHIKAITPPEDGNSLNHKRRKECLEKIKSVKEQWKVEKARHK